MCLYIPPNERIRIANKNITVYKRVSKSSHDYWLPIYHPTRYFQYNTVLTAENHQGYPINRLHLHWKDGVFTINEGFHSWRSKQSRLFPSELNVICIIPEGSEYCFGSHNDIVSTNLIVFRTKLDYWCYKLFRKLT